MLNKKSKKKFSLKQIIFLFFIVLLFSQAGLLLLLYYHFNINDNLRQADLSNFAETLSVRRERLENSFIQKWGQQEHYEEVLRLANDSFTTSKSTHSPMTINPSLASSLIDMTQAMAISGSYIILDDSPKDASQPKQIFYITDNNPDLYSRKKNDILVEAGSLNLTRSLQLTTNSSWNPSFKLSDDSLSQAYKKVYRSTFSAPSALSSELGYWTSVYRSNKNSFDVIAYVIPLIHPDSRQFYGVLGIEVELNYFSKQLLDDPVFNDNLTSFALAKLESESNGYLVFDSIFTKGFHKNRILHDNCIVLRTNQNHLVESDNKVFSVATKDKKNPVVASFSPIKLYSPTSPHTKDKWYLINIISENNLYHQSQDIQQRIIFMFIISLVIEACGYLLVSFFASKALGNLINRIKHLRPTDDLPRMSSSIEEVNQLMENIKKLNNDVADSASRMEQLFAITDIAIGAIEIDPTSDYVRIMGKVPQMLQITLPMHQKKFIAKNYFNELLSNFISSSTLVTNYFPEIKQLNTSLYRTDNPNGSVKYLSIHTKKTPVKTLIIIIDETKKINTIQQIEFERDHDSLTGLLSREAFHRSVKEKFNLSLKNGVMIMWDLDNLKYINDTYGHDVGDYYIQQTAKTLLTLKLPNVLLSRISGDEFFAFSYNFHSKQEILDILEKGKKQLLNTPLHLVNDIDIKIRATTGLAWYDDTITQVDSLIKYADFAMYSAKNSRKGSIRQFDYQEYQADYILFSAKEELNRFIEEKKVHFAFQPIVSAKDGHVFAYEALMRPISDKLKSVTDVLRLAKSQSKLPQIEHLTWFGVLERFDQCFEQFGDAKLFINSIPNTLLSNTERLLLEMTYVDLLDRIVIEMIEHEQTNMDYLDIKQSYKEDWGCQIALDDYGAGYSSESILLAMNPDYIKIDMSIIHNINNDHQRQKLVKNIIDYADSKNIRTIAEGVENSQELNSLIDLGIDYIQGYYVGRPSFEITDTAPNIKLAIQNRYEGDTTNTQV